MGSKAEGVITRSPFNTDLATTIPMIGTVNDLLKHIQVEEIFLMFLQEPLLVLWL